MAVIAAVMATDTGENVTAGATASGAPFPKQSLMATFTVAVVNAEFNSTWMYQTLSCPDPLAVATDTEVCTGVAVTEKCAGVRPDTTVANVAVKTRAVALVVLP